MHVPLKFLEKFQAWVPKTKTKKTVHINIFFQTHSSRYSIQSVLSLVVLYLGEAQSSYSSQILPSVTFFLESSVIIWHKSLMHFSSVILMTAYDRDYLHYILECYLFFLPEYIAYNWTTFSLEKSEGSISLCLNGGVKKDGRAMPVDTSVPNIFSLRVIYSRTAWKGFLGRCKKILLLHSSRILIRMACSIMTRLIT
jgi:hypothetical protein